MAEGGRCYGESTKNVGERMQWPRGTNLLPGDTSAQSVEEQASAPSGREGLFTREEYEKWSERGGPRLRGSSYIALTELDSMPRRWPENTNVHSTNACFLRGLAVTYFHQSEMTKARKLLLSVLESLPLDLDVLLMLAECACALPDEANETFRVAVSRLNLVVSETTNLLPRHIDTWSEKLMENGRFMGSLLLWYALYKGRRTKDSELVVSRKRLTYTCLKQITQNLSLLQWGLLQQSRLNDAVTLMIIDLQYEIEKYRGNRKQKYVEALCCNCICCLHVIAKNFDEGLTFANEGIALMYNAFREEAERRMLYGELLVNKALSLAGIEGYLDVTDIAIQARELYEIWKSDIDEDRKDKVNEYVQRLMQPAATGSVADVIVT